MFEAPFLLWGALAAAIPVVLHLTGRSKPILHRFPAMRFILKSQRASSRALRLKHWLVLLLRMLALALICIALARPSLNSSAVAAGGTFFGVLLGAAGLYALYRREFLAGALTMLSILALYTTIPDLAPRLSNTLHGDFVVVLDRSMSMAYQESEGTRFDLARRQIGELLDRLSPDSRVALLLAGRTTERAQGRLTYRIDVVREKLKEAAVTAEGLDLSRALQAAEDVLARDHAARSDGAPAGIVFFTDMQRNAFEAFAAGRAPVQVKDEASTSAAGAKAPVTFVDVGSDQARNGGVLEASVPGVVLPVDANSTLTAKLRLPDRNHASLVELFLDGKRVDQKLVGATGAASQPDIADVEFRFQTGAAGPHAITLHLADPDRLPLDQDYHVTYTSGRPDRALILEAPVARASVPAASATEKHGTAFFIKAALQPESGSDGTSEGAVTEARTTGMSGLNFTVEPAAELTPAKLANFKVVILADCGALSENSWVVLQQWTNDGGGLFVWLGPKTEPAAVRRFGFQAFAVHRGLLPGTIGEVVTQTPPIQINEVQSEHPLLAHFTLDVARELRNTRISKIVKVTPDTGDGGGNVVLSAGDFPVLLEKSYGRGRVLLSTIDPGLEFSDLVRRGGSFVTLMLNSVHLLAESDSDVNPRLGQPLALTLSNGPPTRQVKWRQPDGKDPVTLEADDLNDDAARSSRPPNGPVTVTVPRLEATGVHAFTWIPAGAKTPLTKLVAVNHDSSEIDLDKMPEADAAKLLEAVKPQFVKQFNEGGIFKRQISQTGEERKYEFAASLLVVLLSLLIAESFLSNRFYRGEDEPADGGR